MSKNYEILKENSELVLQNVSAEKLLYLRQKIVEEINRRRGDDPNLEEIELVKDEEVETNE